MLVSGWLNCKEKSVGIREAMNRNPAVVTGVTMLAIAVAVGFIIFNTLNQTKIKAVTKAYFTADDGKTWFADDITKIPPFKTADGKEAVLANVYSCKGGKEPFVAFMMRYTPEARQKLQEMREQAAASGGRLSTPDSSFMEAMRTGQEVKKTGDATWTNISEGQAFVKVTLVNCPSGKPEDATPLPPPGQ